MKNYVTICILSCLGWLPVARACAVCHASALGSSLTLGPRIRPQTVLGFQQHQPLTQKTLDLQSRHMHQYNQYTNSPSYFAAPRSQWSSSSDSSEADDARSDNSNEQEESPASPEVAPTTEPMSAAMIATIGVYKEFISPLLPPACRFLPTCSQYGVQAIQEFGPLKGSVLTAWRLLRCSPIGGKGYDPPKWPPVAYWYSSY